MRAATYAKRSLFYFPLHFGFFDNSAQCRTCFCRPSWKRHGAHGSGWLSIPDDGAAGSENQYTDDTLLRNF